MSRVQSPVVTVPTPDTAPRQTTVLPPWSRPGSRPGTGRLTRPLSTQTRRVLAARRPGPGGGEELVLTAWLSVLARCVGQGEVCTAVVDADGTMAAVHVDLAERTWQDLALALVRSPVDGPVHSVVDVHGVLPPDAAPLVVGVEEASGSVSLAHDTTVVSGQAAERVAGYLAHALHAASTGPAQVIDLAGMLGAQELHHQLVELCGPVVSCGPDGFVAAFRARAALGPDRRAVTHGERSLTYAELDQASDAIAAHLRRRGVGTGEAVAVISDRCLEWVAALLGVLKSGGVYLPVRPDFPAARVEDQLGRARCRFAVTGPGSADLMASLDGHGSWAGTELGVLELLDRADLVDGPGSAIAVHTPAAADPAYVYFTSGSTGRPKGAVCEHAGMINHLWAKVDDHGLGPDDVVTQTASQCFDISLWQVCAPLLVGGQSVVVDIEDQLDIETFVELLVRHGVTTVQIVPSYLELLLSRLESGAVRLPRLSSVSVTGEALAADLVGRWFTVAPDVTLVNAYGATEVSDDTMHAVLDRPPERDLAIVDVGRPLRNMRVYVMDEQQRLMPEGACGEIVFAGVCVGAGYLNDPQRTAEAFGADPHRPGERLYRSGDLGRWLPEGRLEYLGRRDEQVKIRGLRVEIGEIQQALLDVPGVCAAAVLRTGEGNGARLVGFYVADTDVTSVDLFDLLAARLPDYMVPAHLFRLPELPLNENGKTDKRRLATLAQELSAGLHPFEPPSTTAEHQLATTWAEVLGLATGRVGRHDHFFDLGATSLSAIHLLMRLDHRLSLADLIAHPVLADLAALLDGRADVGANAKRSPLLHELGGSGSRLLLCFPGAAGNAINLRPLAQAAGERVTVVAVEPPGHDLARRDEALITLSELTEDVARQLAREAPPVYCWGQGAGAVTAWRAAQALERDGVDVAGVVLGWDTLFPTGPEEVLALSDAQVADLLRSHGAYVDVDGATPDRLEFVARAYRHDWTQALVTIAETGWGSLRCAVVELTSGWAEPRSTGTAAQVTRRRIPDVVGDLARAAPEHILLAVDRLAQQRPVRI